MKKLISIALALCFVLALVSCGKKDTSSLEIGSGESTEAFVKPEQYASVLLITINPQFKLYLDENENVLAIEAVNKDAESIKDSITVENQSLEAAIEAIVTIANKNGFVKADATISFALVESKETDDVKADILAKVEKKANDTAEELKIEVNVSVEETKTDNSQSSSEAGSNSSQSSSESASSSPSSSAPSTLTAFPPQPVQSRRSAPAEPLRAKLSVMTTRTGYALAAKQKILTSNRLLFFKSRGNGRCNICTERSYTR